MRHSQAMTRSIIAGLVYFVVVYAAGFALGAIRVTLIVPHLGETLAVLMEAPIILAISWMASHWSIARFQVPSAAGARVLMGALAFAVLMVVELGVSAWLFDSSVAQRFVGYRSVAGVIGLATQIAFATFPWVQARQD